MTLGDEGSDEIKHKKQSWKIKDSYHDGWFTIVLYSGSNANDLLAKDRYLTRISDNGNLQMKAKMGKFSSAGLYQYAMDVVKLDT